MCLSCPATHTPTSHLPAPAAGVRDRPQVAGGDGAPLLQGGRPPQAEQAQAPRAHRAAVRPVRAKGLRLCVFGGGRGRGGVGGRGRGGAGGGRRGSRWGASSSRAVSETKPPFLLLLLPPLPPVASATLMNGGTELLFLNFLLLWRLHTGPGAGGMRRLAAAYVRGSPTPSTQRPFTLPHPPTLPTPAGCPSAAAECSLQHLVAGKAAEGSRPAAAPGWRAPGCAVQQLRLSVPLSKLTPLVKQHCVHSVLFATASHSAPRKRKELRGASK